MGRRGTRIGFSRFTSSFFSRFLFSPTPSPHLQTSNSPCGAAKCRQNDKSNIGKISLPKKRKLFIIIIIIDNDLETRRVKATLLRYVQLLQTNKQTKKKKQIEDQQPPSPPPPPPFFPLLLPHENQVTI